MIKFIVPICLLFSSFSALALEEIRIHTWDGYVTESDITALDRLLESNGYDYRVKTISPNASTADSMYNVLRTDKADISFLTLFFIKLNNERLSKVIQPINVDSPRLTNYKYLYNELSHLDMGMSDGKPLYVPFASGIYGFYVNTETVSEKEIPTSYADLLKSEWANRYSLNSSQYWYNCAIASVINKEPPFYINGIFSDAGRSLVIHETKEGGKLSNTLRLLYRNARSFWEVSPNFYDGSDIITSWGPEVKEANKLNNKWKLINFKEGNLIWLDTLALSSKLKGNKLEASEVVINYFIGKEKQERVVTELSLISVSFETDYNPLIYGNSKFFSDGMFVPPHDALADNALRNLSYNLLDNKQYY